MMKRLEAAIRQYKHNDGSDGFVVAYDREETEKAFTKLESDIKIRTLANLRDAIQHDGLINSKVEKEIITCEKKKCTWSSEDAYEYTGSYNTDCGETFMCSDGSENIKEWANFCFYCGNEIELAPLEDKESI